MATPPSRSSLFPSGALLPSAFKTLLGEFYDHVIEKIGSTTAAGAREAMNIALPNYLDNPDGAVYQLAATTAADDAYMDDRWYALTQTAAITPSQVSNPEDGYRYGLRLTQPQASAQRMGRAQIIEGKDAMRLRGKTVTFGGRLKLSSTANVRMAILAWTGTEDSVTSDVVNDWTNSTYTTGNFFGSTSLSLVATSSNALVAATAANGSVSGTVPSNANNIIVLYWTEATAAQNVTLDAWGLRLVEASTLVDYIRRSHSEELRNCKRFFRTSYEGAAPGTATAVGRLTSLSSSTSASVQFTERFGEEMRIVPSMTFYNPSTGSTASPIRNETAGTNFGSAGIGSDYISRNGFSIQTGSAPPASATMSVHYTASANL